MKRIVALLFAVSILILPGCGTVTETIYLQDVKIDGPINHPPIQVTDPVSQSQIKISPKVYLSSSKTVSGLVNAGYIGPRGFYEVDTVFNNDGTWTYKPSPVNNTPRRTKNLNWVLPDFMAGFDFELPVSGKTSIIGNFNYSASKNIDLYGGNLGLSFFNSNENGGLRFNIGLSLQESAFDASTIVEITRTGFSGGSSTEVIFYHDINKNSELNFFTSLIYNSAYEVLPFNFYLSLSFFTQSMLDFEPSTTSSVFYPFVTTHTVDTRGELTLRFISFSPGLYLYASSWTRVMAGVNIIKEIGGMQDADESTFIIPAFKIDFIL